MKLRLLSAPLLLLAGCATTVDKPLYLTGAWGGPNAGIAFNVLGNVQFDCASGSIDMLVYPAKDGSFSAKGVYHAGSPGPVRVGQIFVSQQATYSGSAVKGQMVLSVELEDGSLIGPFNLVEGAAPQITRCV